MSKIAILIPAHNEQLLIEATLQSALKVLTQKDIYVVNDGSYDQSKKIAGKYTKNVFNLTVNVGKASALNLAIAHFKLVEKYQFIMPLDADTKITPNFIEKALSAFKKSKQKKIACIVGKVIGKNINWVTVYRAWEYEVSQTIHKSAQSIIDSIIVCPGCATIYRSSIFKKINIPTVTLAEDMDLTFLIHRRNLGKIVYNDKATVITQDPDSMGDFTAQIDRWYTGFWQCVLKHNIPWQGQALDAEVAMLALEGLFGSLITLVLLIFIPLTFLFNNQSILIAPLAFDFLFFVLPTVILTAIRYRRPAILRFFPALYFLRFISSLIFLKSFLKVVVGIDLSMKWYKATRYNT